MAIRNPMTPLYDVKSPIDTAFSGMQNAAQTYGRMTKNTSQKTEGPGPTIGGAMSSAVGMGMAGYMMAGAAKGGLSGPQGAVIGAVGGLMLYLLS